MPTVISLLVSFIRQFICLKKPLMGSYVIRGEIIGGILIVLYLEIDLNSGLPYGSHVIDLDKV